MECGNVWIVLTAIGLVIYALYKELVKNYDFWKIQNIPFIKPLPIVGSVGLRSYSDSTPLHKTENEWYNTYGRIYGRFEATNPVLSVGDPDFLSMVFSKDFNYFQSRRDMKFHDSIMDNTLFILEGEAWKRVRSIVSPTFTTGKLKKMLPLLRQSCDVLVERLSESCRSSEIVDCQRHFEGFVLHAIGRCAFGMTMDSLKDPNNPFIQKAKKLFQETMSWRTILTILCPKLMKFFRMKLLNPETTEFYKQIIVDVLEERKRQHVVKDDFLQILLDAEYAYEDRINNNGDAESNRDISPIRRKPNYKGLSHDEMLSQCITFFIAGFDPTTSLLSHICYNLAMHPEYQDRVVEEMTRALEEHDGELSYEALSEMKFTDAVIDECMRMCPAMVRSERRCTKDYEFKEGEETKIVLKEGMLVSIPVYAIHHDPEWYPEPYEFKPERFYEPDPNRSKFVHLPFGEGPRVCIGKRFVLLQVKLCLTKVLMKFQLLPAPTTPASLEYIESRNILKVGKVEVCLKERTSN